MMILRWLFSKAVREARAMRAHVRRLLNAQRDLLSPQAIGAVMAAMNGLDHAVADGTNKGRIRIKTEELEFAANKWLKPYPHAMGRENVEVLLVAIAVAMGIRTFFLQPFKIPTGSMQPTLYGVVSAPDFSRVFVSSELAKDQPLIDEQFKIQKSLIIPSGWERIKEWFEGISYLHVVADNDGEVDAISPPVGIKIFNLKQTIVIGGHAQTIWFPPDYGEALLQTRAGFAVPMGHDQATNFFQGHVFHRGEDVIKMKVSAGDHLFVDRLTYNFRPPKRGEIVVFETQGIPEQARDYFHIPDDEFYIKRLVGLGGETLSLAQDYEALNVPLMPYGIITVPVGHLVVDDQPLSVSTPHFANLYSFPGVKAGAKTFVFRRNQYSGHALLAGTYLAPGSDYEVPPDCDFVMGDNTMDSLDSRYWGGFPSQYVIGKGFFVYWPITSRFGWGNQ